MDDQMSHGRSPRRTGAIAVLLGLAGTSATAQTPSLPATTSGSDPNPYYIGVSQAFTHDSNVTRSPSGPSDTYSSTSLLGGIDQPIGRQRIFGNAAVSENRYQGQDQLNNTSYSLFGGLDWATVGELSGNLNASIGQFLSAPAANGVVPGTSRNISNTQNYNAVVRYGGPSRFTVEGTVGYAKVEYSAPEYVTSNSNQNSGSLGIYYRPGPTLRVGLAGRVTNTETPQAVVVVGGGFQSNNVRGENIDFLADYELSGYLNASGRLSYTTQTNSGATNADFSGLTGGLNLSFRPTAKLVFNAFASRDPGFNATQYNGFGVSFINGVTPVLTPISGFYQNNQLTDNIGIGVNYEATAKVTANASLRYSRARLVTTIVTGSGSQPAPDTIDLLKAAQVGANWTIARNWSLACNLSYEKRDVSGGTNYAYTANTIGCAGQYTWR